MADKKLNDDGIIKALELCSKSLSIKTCQKCPFYLQTNCVSALKLNAIDLINRQKAEIERLETVADKDFNQWNMLAEKTKQHYADLYKEAKDSLKAEAYKEFAERLKEIVSQNDYPLADKLNSIDRGMFTIGFEQAIDEVLKEMVGEDE